MKKLFLASALALFGAMNAQETKFGAKAGYVLSSLSADGMDMNFQSKSSFYVGGLVERRFNDNMGVQVELLYAETGAKSSEAGTEVVGTDIYTYKNNNDVKLGNLMVPVSLKYYASERFSISGGFNFAFILSAKNKYSYLLSGGVINENESGTEDIKNDTKSLNLAPFVGAEYNLDNGMFFDARYNVGLTNLVKDTSSGENIKNSFLQVGLGYKF